MLSGGGVYLFDLDSELWKPYRYEELKTTILIKGLYHPRVCITDSQLLDNPAIQRFFMEHKPWLEREVTDPCLRDPNTNFYPLLASCSRGGADCFKALDIMLTPKIEGKYPTYFTRLSPQGNEQFRRDYGTISENEHRLRWLRIADSETDGVSGFLRFATESYFGKAPEKTVISLPPGSPHTLYNRVKQCIHSLKEYPEMKFTEKDKRIMERVLEKVSTAGANSPQTREELHRAIYGGEFPHVHKSYVRWDRSGLLRDPVADEWRFLVNTQYNYDLAGKFGLSPSLNLKWWTTRDQKLIPRIIPPSTKHEETLDRVRVAAPVYLEHLDFEFVSTIRRNPAFMDSIGKLENARRQIAGTRGGIAERVSRNQYKELFIQHNEFLTERFADHLRERGVEIPSKTYIEVAERVVYPGFVGSAGVVFIATWLRGDPAAVTELQQILGKGSALIILARVFFQVYPNRLGRRRTYPARFRQFMQSVAEIGDVEE